MVAGTAIAAEAAMGEKRNQGTPLTVVSFTCRIRFIADLNAKESLWLPAIKWSGKVNWRFNRLSEYYKGNRCRKISVRRSRCSPRKMPTASMFSAHFLLGGFRPVYLYQYTSAAKNNLRRAASPVNQPVAYGANGGSIHPRCVSLDCLPVVPKAYAVNVRG